MNCSFNTARYSSYLHSRNTCTYADEDKQCNLHNNDLSKCIPTHGVHMPFRWYEQSVGFHTCNYHSRSNGGLINIHDMCYVAYVRENKTAGIFNKRCARHKACSCAMQDCSCATPACNCAVPASL